MIQRGGKRQGAGRKAGSGKYGEPTELMRIPKSLVKSIRKQIKLKDSHAGSIPLYISPVPAGSPNWLEDSIDDYIDLSDHLISTPEQTFMVIAKGDSMIGANIVPGSILIADRSIEAKDGHIVIASIDDEITVKRLRKKALSITLNPENKKYRPIKITNETLFKILGVVTFIVNEAV